MKREPKYINYEAISEAVYLLGGLFALYYCIKLAQLTCDFLFDERPFLFVILFYFAWLAVFIFPALFIHGKLTIFFNNINNKWQNEWWNEYKKTQPNEEIDRMPKG